MSDATAPLTITFFGIALLYASVGQAGASGYLAVMALLQFPPATMKITALSLNMVVAGIGTFQFWRAGHLSVRTFYPFGVLGFPFSLAGGAIQLPPHVYHPVAGVILLLSGAQMIRLIWTNKPQHDSIPEKPPFVGAIIAGGAIGFISGATGTGGGVFLAPIIVSLDWVGMRRMAAVTAAHNLLNSMAALIGASRTFDSAPTELPAWLLSVSVGGAIGAYFGSRHLPESFLRSILAFILLTAGGKLLLT